MFERTEPVWTALRGSRVFITGGTGFFGKWLLAGLIWANRRTAAGIRATILSRNPDAFVARNPALAGDAMLSLTRGDIGTFGFPDGAFDHIIHAATDTDVAAHAQPETLRAAIVGGTERVLDFVRASGTANLLYTSSGGIYGEMPPGMQTFPESYAAAPTAIAASAYASGKVAAESLCLAAGRSGTPSVKIARCFAFVGPHLELNGHYAIGNFIRDALAGDRVEVRGDGSGLRSYLYAGDLAAWLWTMLVFGTPQRIYNVGSDRVVSIGQLAHEVAAAVNPNAIVSIKEKPQAGDGVRSRYLPNVDRARAELGLDAWTPLGDGIRRTAEWHAACGSNG